MTVTINEDPSDPSPHEREDARLRCWCQTCRPITFSDCRMVLCPTCGDKRCIHAISHEAPCAKADIHAHNAWVERIILRAQPAPENSAPDEAAMVALGAWKLPTIATTGYAQGSVNTTQGEAADWQQRAAEAGKLARQATMDRRAAAQAGQEALNRRAAARLQAMPIAPQAGEGYDVLTVSAGSPKPPRWVTGE